MEKVSYRKEKASLPIIGEYPIVDLKQGPFATRLNREFITVGERSRTDIDREMVLGDEMAAFYLLPSAQRFMAGEITFEDALRSLMSVIQGIHYFHSSGNYKAKTQHATFERKGARGKKKDKPLPWPEERTVTVMNDLIVNLTDYYGLRITDKVEGDESVILKIMADKLEEQSEVDKYRGWFIPKLRNFHYCLELNFWTHRWLERLRQSPGIQEAIRNISTEDLEQSLMEMRKFISPDLVVPTGVFFSPLLLQQGQAITIYDRTLNTIYESENGSRNKQEDLSDVFAYVELGKKPKPTADLRKTVRQVRHGIANYGMMSFNTANTFGLFRVDLDGRFYRHRFGYRPLEESFVHTSSLREGLFFELLTLMRLYDLTGRPDIIATLPSLDTYEESFLGNVVGRGVRRLRRVLLPGGESQNEGYIRHLVSARLNRNAQENQNPADTISIEEHADNDKHVSPATNIVYEMRPVPVSATLRRLPQGWHASDRAKEIAKEYFQIHDLPEGWTLVSGHMGERLVRINKETGEVLLREFKFVGADNDVVARLQNMVDTINRGENPHGGYARR